jgi:hypothetical protein
VAPDACRSARAPSADPAWVRIGASRHLFLEGITTLSHSTTHPPDTEDRQVLHIPAPAELRRLALADRLSLRFGLWLFERAQRPRRRRTTTTTDPLFLGERNLSPRESIALLTYDLQRQLR